jgi:hypothetical protein
VSLGTCLCSLSNSLRCNGCSPCSVQTVTVARQCRPTLYLLTFPYTTTRSRPRTRPRRLCGRGNELGWTSPSQAVSLGLRRSLRCKLGMMTASRVRVGDTMPTPVGGLMLLAVQGRLWLQTTYRPDCTRRFRLATWHKSTPPCALARTQTWAGPRRPGHTGAPQRPCTGAHMELDFQVALQL